MGHLIIAEKMSAAIRIASSLSDGKVTRVKYGTTSLLKFKRENIDYSVLSLRGHIIEIDFPNSYSNWRIDKLKEMADVKPVEQVKFKGLDSALAKMNQESELVIIATDFDREGEAIGVETLRLMGRDNDVKRARFSALTRSELLESFNHLVEVDYNLAESAEARQIIDLIWGATLTRFFSIETKRLGRDFVSVGRVQSPTLSLLATRELEIRNFLPENYYELGIFIKNAKFLFSGNPIKEKNEADSLLIRLKRLKKALIMEISENERRIYRPAPFSTTEFLKEANKMGISVERAMAIAEALYQHGKISYPRTDNTVYPRTINLKAVLTQLEDSYLRKEIEALKSESRLIPSRGRVETTDHPPIYPTSPMKKNELKGDYFKIYDLIARRFLATLAENAEVVDKEYTALADDLLFSYTASKVKITGWMSYYPFVYYQEREDPSLGKGEEYELSNPFLDEKTTLPPPRYSQGSLIEKMEKEKLGTKSTRHDIIQKLYDRGFIEGNPIRVKALGMAMAETLLLNSVSIAKPEMTAKLEEEMDAIANGTKSKEEVVEDSRVMLKGLLDDLIGKSGGIREKFNQTFNEERVIGKCPKCGSNLVIETGRNYRYIKCEGPAKDFFYFLPKSGKIELTEGKCPECGLFLIKVIRKGQKPELRCVDPKCKYNSAKEVFGKCPSDGGTLVLRRSGKGMKFIGCSNYPTCKVTLSLPQKAEVFPTGKTCDVDGFPIAKFKFGSREVELCLNPKCPSRRGTGD